MAKLENQKLPDNSEEFWSTYLSRINEIEKEQRSLKHKKGLLLKERFKEQPWYRRPTSILSIAAILISIILFTLNFFITQQRKQLTISNTKPNSLVFFANPVKSRTRIVFEDKTIQDMSRSLITIKNSGNKAIQSDDFKDGPILFLLYSATCDSQPKSDSYNVPFLLDVINKNTAGQRQSELKILSRNNPATISYLPTLMNPKDIVELEVYTSSQADFKIQTQGKIADGELTFLTETPENYSQYMPATNRETIFFGLNNLLGAKWVTITFLILLTLGAALLTIYVYEENAPLEYFEDFSVFFISIGITAVFLLASIMAVLT